ncbi:DNA polymerase IV [Sphingomonas nostoxanthinifaciens]|uniref:DNA polymerase IV n=1 Tax=Sphingomonas nostoxanthinifaciens TaxID=2872652 RepID=UPI001CC21897|nr:DNA polymerase IV [Sphingomonas nostoxanthinifaciens]UAK26374.1 DNA polymerase IV [Sphingomonas nostoxanthinifaciens]
MDDAHARERDGGGELRKIIHVDMDAFYASVEQRDDPALRGRPVAVGGSRERGVVAAASYEARVFGVRSAMASSTARRRCPDLIFVKPRFEVYSAISHQIREIFADYTELIEPLSLDEAYLDVSGTGNATAVAREIRARIKAETGLTASAGVSYNKFIAKLASDQNKPDGLCVIPPDRGPGFVEQLAVARFHGVGPKTAERMARLGIATGADLKAQSLPFLERHFGSFADYLYGAARGIDGRPVRANRIRKSVGAERTFFEDIADPAALAEALERVLDALMERIDRSEAKGRTVTLKVKYADFHQITRARSFVSPVGDRAGIGGAGQALLAALLPVPKGVRLLGLALSSLCSDAEQDEVGQLDLVL